MSATSQKRTLSRSRTICLSNDAFASLKSTVEAILCWLPHRPRQHVSADSLQLRGFWRFLSCASGRCRSWGEGWSFPRVTWINWFKRRHFCLARTLPDWSVDFIVSIGNIYAELACNCCWCGVLVGEWDLCCPRRKHDEWGHVGWWLDGWIQRDMGSNFDIHHRCRRRGLVRHAKTQVKRQES